MASTIHLADGISIGQAHAALYRWIKANAYQIIDPPRQVRIQRSKHIDSTQYVTEVQLPVKLLKVSEPIM